MQKKYIVRLTDRERSELVEVVKRLKGTSQKVRALAADAVEGGRRRAELDGPADRRGILCRTKTVENVRQRLVERGFEETLNGSQRTSPPTEKAARWRTGGQDHRSAFGICPPKGYANWTLRLLAFKAVALEIVDSVSHETIRRTLKKTG